MLTEQGSLGSRLHRAEDGTYFSYAQWPDRETYHAERTLSPAHTENLRLMRECIAEWFPPVLGAPVHDLLVGGD